MKTKDNEKLIAVFGATGQQGGGVVRALQASGQFRVRALSRNPAKHRELADEVVEDTLNGQGHEFSFQQVPKEVFAALFPGAGELAEMFSYWEAHTYLGSDSSDRIALANKIAGGQPTKFSTWARANVPMKEAV